MLVKLSETIASFLSELNSGSLSELRSPVLGDRQSEAHLINLFKLADFLKRGRDNTKG